ncbi:asparagine synthetase [Fusarium subglutinans]|uniref:Asparagine synthetase n=1 Tax=Gibberella subglutinans TaxID=42677 RepID=A0A8H5L901_GIBSU|nr:asparagine synthetase [Fusarium subglutinans]KAF5588585.1 asparagine synthetase [Fusarium subglutinans]
MPTPSLHSAADFIFIFNGETDADSLIPDAPNIRIVHRNNTCFDLGAHGEVLREDGLWTHYRRFITMNASIRGPFLPYWAQGKGACWSDLYLARVNERVKLVGMSANCMPRFHIQSMIWATDSVGMELLLLPHSSTSSPADGFGAAGAPVAFHSCYDGWHSAVHAEIGTAEMIIEAGYDVDVMMEAYHKSERFRYDCHADGVGDLLFNGRYFGSNIHPYETIFMKANRDIDPKLLKSLTEWHLAEGRRSWDMC